MNTDSREGGSNMTMRHSMAGFTLIEVMVVVIIIAALAGMVLPQHR